jgi:hypothetical protein
MRTQSEQQMLAICDKCSAFLHCNIPSNQCSLLARTVDDILEYCVVLKHEQQGISGLHRKILLAVGRSASG